MFNDFESCMRELGKCLAAWTVLLLHVTLANPQSRVGIFSERIRQDKDQGAPDASRPRWCFASSNCQSQSTSPLPLHLSYASDTFACLQASHTGPWRGIFQPRRAATNSPPGYQAI
ncbi:hypothetical protein CGMCC3_g2603 [Colletotrichum fructicola]|nr:uncharacterized protein CGMCC3_g2603 [Colletotrichum fructicola]KAE9581530.1 hypothetical protein CGMCC3_g2603 [Colletotrichum fructicola]